MIRKNRIVFIGTVLWTCAAFCVFLGFAYTMFVVVTGETGLDFARARVVALGLGFLPWSFTFAVTRVLYGIEILAEK